MMKIGKIDKIVARKSEICRNSCPFLPKGLFNDLNKDLFAFLKDFLGTNRGYLPIPFNILRGIKSSPKRKAVLSRPRSTKAEFIPGTTLTILPL